MECDNTMKDYDAEAAGRRSDNEQIQTSKDEASSKEAKGKDGSIKNRREIESDDDDDTIPRSKLAAAVMYQPYAISNID